MAVDVTSAYMQLHVRREEDRAQIPCPRAPATSSTRYFAGMQTRPERRRPKARTGRTNAEVGRIFANAMSVDALPADETKYVGQLVAQRTGLSQTDAEKRVTDTFNKAQAKLKDAKTAAKDAADKARKASAYAALWLFVSLLIGAFVASFAATYGGRRRDLF